ncbi:hypothetical protein L1049_001713 [Liquidambar formosana]|uniref:Uncharacterized protein n=1 Tax=Liquidambar formosana TaxID=63359 RepID=A0AAP0R438_LIQFO
MVYLDKIGNAMSEDSTMKKEVAAELQKIDGLTLTDIMNAGKDIISDSYLSTMFFSLPEEKRREMNIQFGRAVDFKFFEKYEFRIPSMFRTIVGDEGNNATSNRQKKPPRGSQRADNGSQSMVDAIIHVGNVLEKGLSDVGQRLVGLENRLGKLENVVASMGKTLGAVYSNVHLLAAYGGEVYSAARKLSTAYASWQGRAPQHQLPLNQRPHQRTYEPVFPRGYEPPPPRVRSAKVENGSSQAELERIRDLTILENDYSKTTTTGAKNNHSVVVSELEYGNVAPSSYSKSRYETIDETLDPSKKQSFKGPLSRNRYEDEGLGRSEREPKAEDDSKRGPRSLLPRLPPPPPGLKLNTVDQPAYLTPISIDDKGFTILENMGCGVDLGGEEDKDRFACGTHGVDLGGDEDGDGDRDEDYLRRSQQRQET